MSDEADYTPRPWRWTPEEKALLQKLMAEGASVDEVMMNLPGRTCTSVGKMCKTMGIPGGAKFEAHRGLRSMTVLGAQKLARQMQDHPNFKAYMRSIFGPNTDYRERACMTCGRKFLSWGPGNRLCDEHRKDANDSYAVALHRMR